MLASIPGFLRTPLVVVLIVLSTIVHTTPLFVVALLKWIVPIRRCRAICAVVLVRLAEGGIGVHSRLLALFARTGFRLEGLPGSR
ncbi:MAG: acyltransferase, partial [Arenimonas sp.]|nr:acyltransferase [Arenimonas sp.]